MQPEVIDPNIPLLGDEKLRREAWVETVAPIWVSTPDRDKPLPDKVHFRAWKVGGIHLYGLHASAQTVERTGPQIASHAVDHVYFQHHLNGRAMIDASSGETPIDGGDILLVDMAQPAFGRAFTGVDAISLCIPRRAFDARVGEVGDLHRSVLSRRDRPLVRLFSDHIRNVRHCLDGTDEEQRTLLSVATVALCNAALTPVSDSGYNRPAVAAIEIRQFIEANLDRTDLGVELLCARFGLSRTPIYALFEPEGGVMTYIRNRRLARAMRILSGVEGGDARRISSVAYACGYENLKSFSKAFHARYGVTPRDVDASFRVGSRWETGTALLSWIKEL